jgi:type I pantothenate kinase
VAAVAGPVAVGKSTVADALGDRWRTEGRSVAVVSTDGFLHPNRVLDERGLGAAKGTPVTYDLDRLSAFVESARAGHPMLAVPLYSHEHYDVVDEPLEIARPEVLVIEGVVALQRPLGDLQVYVDADRADVERWYVERFQGLVLAAADDPSSFYRTWVGLDPEEVAAVARMVWEAVNLPNLVEYIEPTRERADVVVGKAADHAIREVVWARP